jgi:hypothetical protein
MTIYYVNPENGNDANNGLSFASAWKSLANNVSTAGDVVRFMAAPSATSLGITASWVDGGGINMTLFQVPISTSNTSPIVLVANPGHGFVTGDTLGLGGHSVNVNANGMWNTSVVGNNITLLNADGSNSNGVSSLAGANTGTFRKYSGSVVTLSTALTKNISLTGNYGSYGNWTANGVNISTSIINTDCKEGASSLQIAIASGFTTGMAAYYATGLLDLSGYQQISLWIKFTSGVGNITNNFSISLCTDTVGLVPVNTFILPTLGFISNTWQNIRVDYGSALSSAIQSIAFNVQSDQGAQTVLLNNIIACKASSLNDSLSLTSLIGKNNAANEPFLGIQSINGTRVVLDSLGNSSLLTNAQKQGYVGTTESILTYKQECIKTPVANAAVTIVFNANTAGVSGNPILYSGGWDRTNMSSQVGETYFDGSNFSGLCINTTATAVYNNFERFSGVRYRQMYNILADNTTILSAKDIHNNNVSGFNSSSCNNITLNFNNMWNNSSGIQVSCFNAIINGLSLNGSSSTGLSFNGSTYSKATINNIYNNNFAVSATTGFNAYVLNSMFKYNTNTFALSIADIYCYNCIFTGGIVLAATTKNNIMVWSMKDGGILNTNYGYTDGGTIVTNSITRHTPTDVSWQLSPTTSVRTNTYPLRLKIATVALTSGIALTVKAWVLRDDVTNLFGRIKVYGGIVPGVLSDVVSNASAAINVWEQLSITMTSTETGVVEVYAECWSIASYTGSMYVDDISFA